eukprot:766305-Hanusia_phi.AAC.1
MPVLQRSDRFILCPAAAVLIQKRPSDSLTTRSCPPLITLSGYSRPLSDWQQRPPGPQGLRLPVSQARAGA